MALSYDTFVVRLMIAVLIGVAYRLVFHLIYRPQRSVVVKQHREMWGGAPHAMRRDFIAQILDAPLEELLFRLWIPLLPFPLNWCAVVGTSLVFSAFHFKYRTVVYHFFMGIVFSLSMLYLGWWAGIVTHVVFNLTGIVHVYKSFRKEEARLSVPCASDCRRV